MTPTKVAVGSEESLLISASSLLGNLFTDEALVVACSLGKMNKIKTTFLLDIEATSIAFINLEMTRHVCDVLKISFIQLAKLKPIKKFDSKPAPSITHAIYSMLIVQSHIELLALFLITKLGQHPLIFGKFWMRKYNAILDMSCDKLAFWPGYCQHLGALTLVVNIPIESHFSTSMYLRTSTTMSLASYVENPTTSAIALAKPQKSKKSIKIPPAIPSVWLAYWSISKLVDSKRERYVVSAKYILKPAMTPKPAPPIDETKLLDLVFIGTMPFQYLVKQKDVEIFAVFMRDIKNKLNAILMKDIKYQLNKMAKTSTNPKTMIPKEYHEFLNIFLKEALNTLLSHLKYNHQIRLLEGYRDYGHSLFSKISESKLQFVKKFLEKYLKKRFIKANSAPCLLWIMLAAKPGGGIRFCINYRYLNKLTNKDAYPIPLIKKTLAQLKNAKVFTKIDFYQAFHKLRLAADLEDLTMFALQFGAFKWKILSFELTEELANWQWFINNVLWEYLNKFCIAYLDNILIYSSNLKEYKEHLRLVLAKLCEFGIQANVDKCKFYVTKTKYLRLIISTEGIKMDPAKIKAIRQWDMSMCVREVQLFIEFCNFYK